MTFQLNFDTQQNILDDNKQMIKTKLLQLCDQSYSVSAQVIYYKHGIQTYIFDV